MKLFCDENFGSGVPEALRLVCACRGISVDYIGRSKKARRRARRLGASDLEWIEFVGKSGFLGLSMNTKILENDEEREAIRVHGAGIVFLTTGQDDAVKLLQLLLKELDWLREVHETVRRPFAFTLTLSRRKKQVLGESQIGENEADTEKQA